MMAATILVSSATFKYHQGQDLRSIKKLITMVSDILATSVIMYQRRNIILTYIYQIKEGSVKYLCKKCDFHARSRGKLTALKQAKHEGIRFSCNQCEVETLTNFICLQPSVRMFCIINLSVAQIIQEIYYTE